jgi:nucleoside-diphosphate-sugar epimerase
MNEKRIIIAGGAGFLGSHLVDRMLLRRDVEKLVVVDNLWTGLRTNIGHYNDSRLIFAHSDVESFKTDERFDEVYHLASPASPQWYMVDPERTISANIRGAFRLRELLKPDGRFCFTSTSEVYGDPDVSPQPETYRGWLDCTGPRSAFDESKRCTESYLFEMHRAHGLDIRVVRLFNVYGPRTRVDDGRAVSNFITQALSGKPLTIYGDGEQSRSWGFVDDVIDALERYFWKDGVTYIGPVNIGNDREIAVIDVARYVRDLIPGSRIVHVDPMPQDPTNRRPDLTVARRILPGWRCAIELEEGVRRTLNWYAGHLNLAQVG